ncbi:Hypothetical predicted protein [Mytilus galloprovincialis]|uniref:DZIP3-like HEPN domain-containing protein n=1 Tax=Mytilus galloprovincialis TaxID=29158 RepID=A0A8B6CME1_MYTGA|nr:Hypothetical predicted protein [Mytilus galloprovincialis]
MHFFTGSTTVTSADLDLTLIICLLRNIPPLLTEPPTGFDYLPPCYDTSDGANIGRLKYYKNFFVSHSNDGKLPDAVFVRIWNDLEQAIKGLDNSHATAARLKDAEIKMLDDSMVQLLSTTVQLDTKVSNFEKELKHISIHIDKNAQEMKQLKQITETLVERMKIKEDSFKSENKECKENEDNSFERLKTSEEQTNERVKMTLEYLGELYKFQRCLDSLFTQIETIVVASKNETKDVVASLCSKIQVYINKLKKHEERMAAIEIKCENLPELQRDVESFIMKSVYELNVTLCIKGDP